MASASGGVRGKDKIPEVEMQPEALGQVGSKRARDYLDGESYHNFCGVTTFGNRATISSHMPMNSDGTFEVGGHYMHGTHGVQTLSDFNTLRSTTISSHGENLGNKIKMPIIICTLFSKKGRCIKGDSCPFLHEIEGPGSDYRWNNEGKAGLFAAYGCGNSRGSEEGSQVCLSNLKVPQVKDSDGLTEDKLNHSLIRVYGETDKSVHGADNQSTFTPGFSHGIPSRRFGDAMTKKLTTPELVPSSIVYEENQEPQYKSFDLSIPSDPLQHKKLSAYGGTAGSLPITHHKKHLSSHALYINPLYATSDHPIGSGTHEPSHLGNLSQHLSSPVTKMVGPNKYIDAGTGTSRPALLASNSPQLSIGSPGSVSPIKDEVWVTSVPFVPSFDFPDLKTPPRQYDPFVDYIDSPKDNKHNLKSSSISSPHTNPYVATKSLNHDEKLARNASYRGHNSSLDDNNKVEVHDIKPDVASYNVKMRNLRFRLADHVKELITPMWKEGSLTKDAYKLVVKKSIDKVLSSIGPSQVPTSEDAISKYITISESKIQRLVKAYVDMHRRQEVQSS